MCASFDAHWPREARTHHFSRPAVTTSSFPGDMFDAFSCHQACPQSLLPLYFVMQVWFPRAHQAGQGLLPAVCHCVHSCMSSNGTAGVQLRRGDWQLERRGEVGRPCQPQTHLVSSGTGTERPAKPATPPSTKSSSPWRQALCR